MFARSSSRTAATMSLFAGLALSAAAPAWGQVFQRHIDIENGGQKDFDQWRTRDGGYVTTGATSDAAGIEDLVVTRFDPDGLVIWQTVYTGRGRDIGYSVQETEEGDFVVAGETDSFGPGLGMLVLRLDAGGSLIWASAITGTIDADPLHDPYPGVALDQAPDGTIVIVGSVAPGIVAPLLPPLGPGSILGGLPVINRVAPDGSFIDSSVITDLALVNDGRERFHYNFTDVRIDRSIDPTSSAYDILVSGTSITSVDPIGNPGGPGAGPVFGERDAMFLRTDSRVLPYFAFRYNTPSRFTGNPLGAENWGHGLSVDEEGTIVLNGKTDFGSLFGIFPAPAGAAAEFGSELIILDPGGAPLDHRRYDHFSPDGLRTVHAPAYAAVEWDVTNPNREPGVIFAGTDRLHDGSNAFLHRTNLGLSTVFANNYGGRNVTDGESLTLRRCGYGLSGGFFGIGPFDVGTGVDQYLVKTDDDLKTPCLVQPLEVAEEQGVEPRDLPIICVYPQIFERLPDLTRQTDFREFELCYDPDCGAPGPCSPADLAPPFGVISNADVTAFVAAWFGMDPAADLAPPFGVWSNADVQAFVALFFAGCP